MNGIKPAEPTTLATDLSLAILGLVFGMIIVFYYIKKKEKRTITLLMWILSFFSITLFALFGAISHGTTSVTLSDIMWQPTMIFGGISFVFFASGTIIYQKEEDYLKDLILPVLLVIGYLIIGFIINWPFLLWVFLLLICSVIIFFYSFKARKKGKKLANYLIIGLIIILISGVIQAIGGIIGFEMMYGPNEEYLFQPHNDIFHLIAMVGLTVFFIGILKEIKPVK